MRNVIAATFMIASVSAPAGAQPPAGGSARQQQILQLQQAAAAQRLKEARYQIGQMERLLEGAVEHGATVIRDRLAAVMPADMLLTEDARARGFRLDGYGMFFDVEVPSLAGTLPWTFQTLDQNDLGLDSALRTLRAFVERAASNDVNLQQALKRIELQVSPTTGLGIAPSTLTTQTAGARNAVGSAASVVDAPDAAASANPAAAAADPASQDPILADPNQAYRTQITEALIDTMLEHSRSLGIAPNEVLTVAVRGVQDRPRLAQVDTDSRTHVITVRGADLTAFLGGQISREDARKRIEVRVF
jgi:hypothetical protein